MRKKKVLVKKKKTETPIRKKKIGVLTGGGDCPGLNNAIKEIFEIADEKGYEVEGLTEGWKGPIMAALEEYPVKTVTLPLDWTAVRRIDREGGTILMSSRKNPFNYEGNDVSDEVVKFLNRRYDAVISIGGEDTNGVSGKLARKGLKVVGVPKTIDKDLCGTDTSLGYDSALDFDTKALERIRSTAGSHGMIYFVETMGRHAGHLAYWSAAASNTHFLTIPEVEVDLDALFEKIIERKKSLKMRRGYSKDGSRYSIVAVAEGTKIKGVGEIVQGGRDPSGNVYLGGVAEYLVKLFKERGYESRSNVLGHQQRAGPPTHKDRVLGILLGRKAVELVENEAYGRMVSVRGAEIRDIRLETIIDRIRILDAQVCYDASSFKPTPWSFDHEIEVDKRKR